jgi:hypothetical protein
VKYFDRDADASARVKMEADKKALEDKLRRQGAPTRRPQ